MIPRIAAVVLAAGRGTRMGGGGKLLADLAGKPLVLWAVDAAVASAAEPVLVVTGHEADATADALAGRPVTVVPNPDHDSGQSTSVRRGVAALPDDADGVVILLGDMPKVRAGHIDRLISAFRPGAIVVPVFGGRRGNPVLWPREDFAALAGVSGDMGGRALLKNAGDRIVRVDMPDDGVLVDVDTPDALARLRGEGQA